MTRFVRSYIRKILRVNNSLALLRTCYQQQHAIMANSILFATCLMMAMMMFANKATVFAQINPSFRKLMMTDRPITAFPTPPKPLSRISGRAWETYGQSWEFQDFTSGDKVVKYNANCIFVGNDIDQGKLFEGVKLMAKCVNRCLENPECTHYTYSRPKRMCYIQRGDQMQDINDASSYCGFIASADRRTVKGVPY